MLVSYGLTVKYSKNGTPKIITVIDLQMEQFGFQKAVMRPKDANGTEKKRSM